MYAQAIDNISVRFEKKKKIVKNLHVMPLEDVRKFESAIFDLQTL
jgi:hypothetical protein